MVSDQSRNLQSELLKSRVNARGQVPTKHFKYSRIYYPVQFTRGLLGACPKLAGQALRSVTAQALTDAPHPQSSDPFVFALALVVLFCFCYCFCFSLLIYLRLISFESNRGDRSARHGWRKERCQAGMPVCAAWWSDCFQNCVATQGADYPQQDFCLLFVF